MKDVMIKKVDALFDAVTKDDRWDFNDNALFDVFGMSLYGYAFGVGRLLCFLDADDINTTVEEKLIGLGAGEKYVKGMVEYAFSTFQTPTEGLMSQLVGIGHSYFTHSDISELKELIFRDAEIIKQNK